MCFIMASIFPSNLSTVPSNTVTLAKVCSALTIFPVSPLAFILFFNSPTISLTRAPSQPHPGLTPPPPSAVDGVKSLLKLTQQKQLVVVSTLPSSPYGIRLVPSTHGVHLEVNTASSGSRMSVVFVRKQVLQAAQVLVMLYVTVSRLHERSEC